MNKPNLKLAAKEPEKPKRKKCKPWVVATLGGVKLPVDQILDREKKAQEAHLGKQ